MTIIIESTEETKRAEVTERMRQHEQAANEALLRGEVSKACFEAESAEILADWLCRFC